MTTDNPGTTRDQAIEQAVKVLSANWRNMHTNESLGYQRMLAKALMDAGLLRGGVDTGDEADCDGRILRWGKRHEQRADCAEAEVEKLRAERDQALAEVERIRSDLYYAVSKLTEARADRDRAVADQAALRARVEKLADSTEASCDFTYGGICGTHQCDVEDYRGIGRRECALVASIRALDGGQS